MNTLIRLIVIAMVSSVSLRAESLSLVRAAELTTNYLKTEKIDGRTLSELFIVVALRRVNFDPRVSTDQVVWRVDLGETNVMRDDPRMTVALTEDGKKYRRVLEIKNDEVVRFGRMPDFPRPVVVGTNVVPNHDKK